MSRELSFFKEFSKASRSKSWKKSVEEKKKEETLKSVVLLLISA
jgi:hypothetical protein